MEARSARERAEAVAGVLRGRRRLLVLTHTNPDPDSMGSALGLRCLARERFCMDSRFGMLGRVMRAENQAMVRCLGIDPVPLERLDLEAFDCLALVDSQPGFGHTSLPVNRAIDLVVDHHAPPEATNGRTTEVKLSDVRTEVGATCSIVTSYLMELGVNVPADVATGLFYGIRTDTAGLSRNASALDVAAYEFLRDKVDRLKLAEITNPPLPLAYFQALRDALNNIRIYDRLVLCSLGKVSSAEMVAEVADLLVRLEGVQTVFCGGIVDQTYYMSVRDDDDSRDAWHLIRDALGGEGTFGGHGSIAGGSIVLPDDSARTAKRLERRLERNILKTMGIAGTTVAGLVEG